MQYNLPSSSKPETWFISTLSIRPEIPQTHGPIAKVSHFGSEDYKFKSYHGCKLLLACAGLPFNSVGLDELHPKMLKDLPRGHNRAAGTAVSVLQSDPRGLEKNQCGLFFQEGKERGTRKL